MITQRSLRPLTITMDAFGVDGFAARSKFISSTERQVKDLSYS